MNIDFYSILIITREGKLIRKRCPFQAEVLKDLPPLDKGQIVQVDKVLEFEGRLVYYVHSKAYIHHLLKVL